MDAGEWGDDDSGAMKLGAPCGDKMCTCARPLLAAKRSTNSRRAPLTASGQISGMEPTQQFCECDMTPTKPGDAKPSEPKPVPVGAPAKLSLPKPVQARALGTPVPFPGAASTSAAGYKPPLFRAPKPPVVRCTCNDAGCGAQECP